MYTVLLQLPGFNKFHFGGLNLPNILGFHVTS